MSDSERKLRIDAVARALRKFGLVDDHDNTVTRLLLRSRIPRVQKVTAAVSRLDRVPKGASKHIALTVIADALPDREIRTLPAREILLGGGGLHCITQQIPA